MSWEKAWSCLPINYNTSLGKIENTTQRTYFTNNITGNRVKIKFSNKYGKAPLRIEKLMLAQLDNNNRIESQCVITYQKKEKLVVYEEEEFYSDAVMYEIKAGKKLALYMFLKEANIIQTACATWSTGIWTTRYKTNCAECCFETSEMGWKESREMYPCIEADSNKADVIAGVSEIIVDTAKEIVKIALFGDSITHMSFFADYLSSMLFKQYPEKVSIWNFGIGGNRLLRNASYAPHVVGKGACFGEAGIKRFEKDIFQQNKPDIILFLEGINDIMHPYELEHLEEKVNAEELSEGIQKIVGTAHKYESKIYIGTIMPFFNQFEKSWGNEAEEVRNKVNNWIRKYSQADNILDYDIKLRDIQRNSYIQEEFHIGDGLHPNGAGGKQMAEVAFALLNKEIQNRLYYE